VTSTQAVVPAVAAAAEVSLTGVALVLVGSAGEELLARPLLCTVGAFAWVGELLLQAVSSRLTALPRAAAAMARGCASLMTVFP
jgi:hypothetical protein